MGCNPLALVATVKRKGSLILFNVFVNRGYKLFIKNSRIVHMLKVTQVLNIKQNTEIVFCLGTVHIFLISAVKVL